MQHAHEPDPPPPVGTGSSPSTAPGRRGVELLSRARVLPDPALPLIPRARARYRGWSVFQLVFPFYGVYPDCAYTPARLGVFMLQC